MNDIDNRWSALGRDTGRHPPVSKEWRYYRMAVWPDLFGRALLARHWGRIGTQGRIRLEPHPDPGAAINALARLAGAKRRRGYRDSLA